MSKLIVFRGLPGSGKTTMAMQSAYPAVCRDDIRMMLFGKLYGEQGVDEDLVTLVEEDIVKTILSSPYGEQIIQVHDTNLVEEHYQRWVEIARIWGAELDTVDLRRFPLQTCLDRNEGRKGTLAYVPPEAIQAMYDRHIAGQGIY